MSFSLIQMLFLVLWTWNYKRNGEIPKKYLGKAEEQTFHVAVDEFLHNHTFVQRDYCSGIRNEEK